MDRRQFASSRPTLYANDQRNGSPPRGWPPDDRSSSGPGRSILSGAMGIAIPGKARPPSPPPPLPPPRFAPMEGEAAGSNPGWAPAWGSDLSGGFGRRQSTDKCPKGWAKGPNANSAPELAGRRERQVSRTTSASTGDSERGCTFSRIDEGYWSLPASNPVNQHLPGERRLHHQDQEKSSQTYDNKLLSKLGRPKTPPRSGSIGSIEDSPSSSLTFGRQPLPQLRSLSFPNSATSGYSDSPIKREPGSRLGDSPLSRPISPNTSILSGPTRKSSIEYRSPTLSTRSSTLESEIHSPYSQRFPSSIDDKVRPQKSRRSVGGSLLSDVDESAVSFYNNTSTLPTRLVKKENYDHSLFSEQESTTFRMEDHVEKLHLDDRAPHTNHRDPAQRQNIPYHHVCPSQAMSGISERKRKVAQMASHDEANAQYLKDTASTANEFQHSVPTQLSPNHYSQHQASMSSQPSMGFRNGSYASPAAPPGAPDSYSSFAQHSGQVSPTEQQQQQQYQQQMSHDVQQYHEASFLDPDAQQARTGPYPKSQQQHDPIDTKPPPRKTNAEPARRGNVPESMPTSTNFICSCCPKKPRKFDTLEEKLQHEAEKQYRCEFCSNRFKNKNEMERHKNSLHLRRNSWSCAELARDYTRAFFPSSELPPPTNMPGPSQPSPSPYDTCGYCGEGFNNDPPDWENRMRHLDMVHKFRECNQSKKFFRADHFRQHLKHSHTGTSGKWTNRLEQACIKDEPPALPNTMNDENNMNLSTPSAPVANMGSVNQQEMIHPPLDPNMGQADMSQQGMPQQNYLPPSSVGHPSPQIDLSNIDPNIGYQPMPTGHMGNMGPPQSHGNMQQLAQQAGLNFERLKEDM